MGGETTLNQAKDYILAYNKVKSVFEREKYVDVIWMEAYRSALAQFRMGISQINVHRYRFSPTKENTTCPFCPEKVESEVHFLLQRPMYNQLRVTYLYGLDENVDSERMLVLLLTNGAAKTIVNTANCFYFLRLS